MSGKQTQRERKENKDQIFCMFSGRVVSDDYIKVLTMKLKKCRETKLLKLPNYCRVDARPTPRVR